MSTDASNIGEADSPLVALIDRRDRIGAVARVLLALERNEKPTRDDLKEAGFPTRFGREEGA